MVRVRGKIQRRGLFLACSVVVCLSASLLIVVHRSSARQRSTLAAPVVSTPHQQPQVIVAVGDSITYGLHDDEQAGGWVTRLASRLTADYPGVPYKVVNAGRNGDTAAGVLKRVAHDVIAYHPQLVILSVGTNDFDDGVPAPDFRYTLTRLINQLKAAGTLVLAVSILPRAGVTPQLLAAQRAYNATISRVCADIGVGYLDEFDRWSALGSVELKRLRADVEHPNPIGYRLLAGSMAAFLETQYLSPEGLLVQPDQRPASDLIPDANLAGESPWRSVNVQTSPATPISLTVTSTNGHAATFSGHTDARGLFVAKEG